MPRPEILLVSEVYPPTVGGSGVLLEEVYARLTGVEVAVLTEGSGSSRLQRGRHVDTVFMGAPDWGVLGYQALRRHARVARAIRSSCDSTAIVHCGRGLPEGLSAWLARRRYVCWTHGEELGFASTSRELTWLLRRVYAGAAAILANSHNSARLLADWAVPAERVVVVHPGVDPAVFSPDIDGEAVRRRYAPNGELLLLSVGRLQRRKGHDVTLDALARNRDRQPAMRYLIAGDGPHRAALEAQVTRLGLGEAVTFLGAVDDVALPSLYAGCDVFVLPNRQDGVDFEGFGIVFLEAAASGRATIGGRSGGVVEAVEDGVTGLLVDGTQPSEVADAIGRLADSKALRLQYGAAGRQRVLRAFTWDRSAARVARLHAELTGNGDAKRATDF